MVVNQRFQLKPLLPLLGGNDRFFLLALSQHAPRLYEGRRHAFHEVAVPDMPPAIEQALNYDSGERGNQAHATARGDAGRAGLKFHGQGGDRENAKDELTQYFRLVDAALQRVLKDHRAPLILAGVQYLLPIYRSVCSYGTVASEELPGNFEHVNAQELHRRAWPLIQQQLDQAREDAAARYRQLAGTGKTSNDVRHIVPAACQGQVETLFVDPLMQLWGRFEPAMREAEVGVREKPATTTCWTTPPCRPSCTGGPCTRCHRSSARLRR